MTKSQIVTVDVNGRKFDVDIVELEKLHMTPHRQYVTAYSVAWKIKGSNKNLHEDIIALIKDVRESVTVPVPGIGCKTGTVTFVVGYEDGVVQPIDIKMNLTAVEKDHLPYFMRSCCDENELINVYDPDDLWEQVIEVQNDSNTNKMEKAIANVEKKYDALCQRIAAFINVEFQQGGDQRLAIEVIDYYESVLDTMINK